MRIPELFANAYVLSVNVKDQNGATVNTIATLRSVPGVTPQLVRSMIAVYRAATWLSPRMAARLALELFITPRSSKPTTRELAVLATAWQRRLAFGRGHLQIYAWGDSGPTVLLVHGWSSSAARLAGFVEPLLRAGCRVIAFDAPGNGASSGWHSDLRQFRRALALTLDTCGPIAGIVAHSFGARAAVRLLAESPRASVRALSLIGMPRDVSHMMEWFQLTLELREDVHRLMRDEFVRLFGRPPERHVAERHARPLSVPALIVHDREDELAPFAHAQALVEQLPNAELLVTDGLCHCGPLDDGATIAAIVSFVARHAGAPRAVVSESEARAEEELRTAHVEIEATGKIGIPHIEPGPDRAIA